MKTLTAIAIGETIVFLEKIKLIQGNRTQFFKNYHFNSTNLIVTSHNKWKALLNIMTRFFYSFIHWMAKISFWTENLKHFFISEYNTLPRTLRYLMVFISLASLTCPHKFYTFPGPQKWEIDYFQGPCTFMQAFTEQLDNDSWTRPTL